MSGPEAAQAICRFIHDTSALLLWGACAYLAALVPRGLREIVGRHLEAGRICGIVAAVTTTAAALPLDAAAIGNGWPDAVDPATLRAVLFETSVGSAWQAQSLAAVLLAATLFAPPRLRMIATAVASGLLLGTLALTGHAAMHEGLLGGFHRANDIAHVLAGGAWLGALVPLLAILKALADSSQRREAGIALERFSTLGHTVVSVVVTTGVVNTSLILGRWPSDWSFPYQALLALKIILVVVITALALANRYGFVPRFRSHRGQALRFIRLGTLVETGLGLVVIACVSVFGLLEPA